MSDEFDQKNIVNKEIRTQIWHYNFLIPLIKIFKIYLKNNLIGTLILLQLVIGYFPPKLS